MTTPQLPQIAYSVEDAAKAVAQSVATIRRAIHTTGVDKDGNATFPPPLKAKRAGNKLLIPADELRAWVASLPDA